jgi:hypothetical protein
VEPVGPLGPVQEQLPGRTAHPVPCLFCQMGTFRRSMVCRLCCEQGRTVWEWLRS